MEKRKKKKMKKSLDHSTVVHRSRFRLDTLHFCTVVPICVKSSRLLLRLSQTLRRRCTLLSSSQFRTRASSGDSRKARFNATRNNSRRRPVKLPNLPTEQNYRTLNGERSSAYPLPPFVSPLFISAIVVLAIFRQLEKPASSLSSTRSLLISSRSLGLSFTPWTVSLLRSCYFSSIQPIYASIYLRLRRVLYKFCELGI